MFKVGIRFKNIALI